MFYRSYLANPRTSADPCSDLQQTEVANLGVPRLHDCIDFDDHVLADGDTPWFGIIKVLWDGPNLGSLVYYTPAANQHTPSRRLKPGIWMHDGL